MEGLFMHLKEMAELQAQSMPALGRGRQHESGTIGGEPDGDIKDMVPIKRV